MNSNRILFLSASEVRRALPMRDAVEAMKTAFGALSANQAVVPLRSHLEAAQHHGKLLLMPCYLPSMGALSLKTVSVYDGNPAQGLPRIQALVILYDAATGSPRAIMDGTSLTALRTGAASGAATDLLARPDASTAAILGAGAQGRTQLEAVCSVRKIQQAWVYDANPQAASQFSQAMSASLGFPIKAVSESNDAVRGADIICAATSSTSPVFCDSDLKSGVHINGVGAFLPTMQEVPTETVLRARVLVDHRESAMAEAGDIMVPIAQGRYSFDRIAGELGDVVNGKIPGRTQGDEITFFKSVGVAIQDLVAASRIHESALHMGMGTWVEQ